MKRIEVEKTMASEERDSFESRKEQLETALKETFEEYADDYDDESDAVFEAVDGCIPIYNQDIMDVAADPDVWARNLELEPQENTLIEYAKLAIFEALREHAYELIDRNGWEL